MQLTVHSKHNNLYFFGLALLVAGLPLSKFLMSISQFVLLANWLWEGGLKIKFIKFRQNKIAVAISSVFILHIAGLVHTNDFQYAFHDIRIKLPLLALPVILSSIKPLEPKKFKWLMWIFVTAVLTGTIASIFELLGFNNYLREFSGKPLKQITDTRDISVFISHIRFGLMICLCFVFLIYEKAYRIIRITICIWLLIFLYILESITGLAILFLLGLYFGFIYALTQKGFRIKLIFLVLSAIIPVTGCYYISHKLSEIKMIKPIIAESLAQTTRLGNKYDHNLNNLQTENGNMIWIYIASEELKKAWNNRSSIGYDETDMKGQQIKYTLIRFLTSKGLRKDAEGVNVLTTDEVNAIERGVANVNYQNLTDLRTRIDEIIWEYANYKMTGNPSGYSVMQRIEYWKAAIFIIKQNLFIGVGTGDAPAGFAEQYYKNNSKLSPQWRLRSHNQYLAIAVSFGIIGLIWFLCCLFSGLVKKEYRQNTLFVSFLAIASLSMLAEDTLETQAGVTFFAFFYCLLLFHGNKLIHNQPEQIQIAVITQKHC